MIKYKAILNHLLGVVFHLCGYIFCAGFFLALAGQLVNDL